MYEWIQRLNSTRGCIVILILSHVIDTVLQIALLLLDARRPTLPFYLLTSKLSFSNGLTHLALVLLCNLIRNFADRVVP